MAVSDPGCLIRDCVGWECVRVGPQQARALGRLHIAWLADPLVGLEEDPDASRAGVAAVVQNMGEPQIRWGYDDPDLFVGFSDHNRPVYVALAVTVEGVREILGPAPVTAVRARNSGCRS